LDFGSGLDFEWIGFRFEKHKLENSKSKSMRLTGMITICKYYNHDTVPNILCSPGPSVKSKVSALPPCWVEHLILKIQHNTTRRPVVGLWWD